MNRHLALLTLSASTIAACATTATPPTANLPGREACVQQASVRGWTVLDDRNLVIDDVSRSPYLIRLIYPAPDLFTREQLGFDDGDRNAQICSNGDSLLVDGPMPQRVPIVAVRSLSAEEAATLRGTRKSRS